MVDQERIAAPIRNSSSLLRSGMPPTAGFAIHATLHSPDVDRAYERYRSLLRSEKFEVRQAGEALFRTIATPNWSVEWNLPRWVGGECGLPEQDLQALVSANVLGLGYIRLADDIQDGDGISQRQATERLGACLYEAAKRAYQSLVGDSAWFWLYFDACLETWRRASLPVEFNGYDSLTISGFPDRLADFGAPLNLCCAAACLLAGDQQRLFEFLEPVQHYLKAAVLYDHFKDWRQDLEAGRENVFILIQTGMQSRGRDPELVRREVEIGLIDESGMRAYIGLITSELSLGAAVAARAKLPALARHLEGLNRDLTSSGQEMLEGIAGLLDRAARALEPDP